MSRDAGTRVRRDRLGGQEDPGLERHRDQPAEQMTSTGDSPCLGKGFVFSSLIALCVWLALPRFPIFDFTLFWKASQHLVQGSDPYRLPPYAEFVDSDLRALSPRNVVLPPLSTPAAFGFLGFIGKLSLDRAKDVYLLLMYFSFCWSAWLGYKLFFGSEALAPFAEISLLIACLPLGLYYQAMVWGSMTVICLIGLCGFFVASAYRRTFLAGGFLALCSVKPHLFVLLFAFLIWWSWRNRQARLLLGTVTVTAAALGTVLLLQPRVLWMYLEVLRSGAPFEVIDNASLGGLLYSLSGKGYKRALYIPTVLALIGMVPLIRLPVAGDFRMHFACLIPFSVVLSPYCWGHDYIVCFPVSFLAAACFRRCSQAGESRHTQLLGALIAVNGLIVNFFSPMFRLQWLFISYGVTLSLLSIAILFTSLKPDSPSI